MTLHSSKYHGPIENLIHQKKMFLTIFTDKSIYESEVEQLVGVSTIHRKSLGSCFHRMQLRNLRGFDLNKPNLAFSVNNSFNNQLFKHVNE